MSSISSLTSVGTVDSGRITCELATHEKNDSTSKRREVDARSRAPAERIAPEVDMDSICSFARLAAASSHRCAARAARKQTPYASAASQAIHSGLLARILGSRAGHNFARASVIGNSRELCAPTALNHTAPPFVSKRIKLKMESALNCSNDPVRRKAWGRSMSAIQRVTSVNQSGRRKGSVPRAISFRSSPARKARIAEKSSGREKDRSDSDDMDFHLFPGSGSLFRGKTATAW